MRPRLPASLVRSAIATVLSGTLVIQVLTVVSGVLLARSLGAYDRGALAVVILWPSLIAAFSNLGIQDSLTFHASRLPDRLPGLFGGCLLFSGWCSCAGVVVGSAVISALDVARPSLITPAHWMYLGFIPLNVFTVNLLGIMLGMGRFGHVQVVRITVVALSVGLVLGLAVAHGLTLVSVTVAYLVANLITCAMSLTMTARAVGSPSRPSRELNTDVFRYGTRVYGGSLATMAIERLDQIIMSLIFSPQTLGLYVVAATTASPLATLGTTLATVSFPRIAGTSSPAQVPAIVMRLAAMGLVLALIFAVPIGLGASWIIPAVFGPAFEGSVTAARLLVVAGLFLCVARIYASALKGIGRPMLSSRIEFFVLAISAAGLLVALPAYGITGAAVVSLVAYSLSCGGSIILLTRELRSSEAGPDRPAAQPSS